MIVTRTTVKSGRAYLSIIGGLFLGTLFASNSAWGIVPFGRGEWLITGSAGVTRDSNLYANADDLGDSFFTITPGVQYIRSGARGDVDFASGVTINRFDEFDSENSNDIFANFGIDLPTASSAKLSGQLSADYFDGRETDLFLSDRFQVKRFGFGGNGRYRISSLTNLRFGLTYSNYQPENRQNNRTYQARIGAGYQIRPQIFTYFDYGYGKSTSDLNTTTGNQVGSTDHNFRIGANGRFSPFLSGNVGFGYLRSIAGNSDSAGDRNGLTADISLLWEPRTGTSVAGTVSAGSQVTNAARTVERIRTEAVWAQSISTRLEARTTLAWLEYRYRNESGTTNDLIQGSLELVYSPNKYSEFGIQVNYFEQWSFDAFRDYSRNIVSGTATFRY